MEEERKVLEEFLSLDISTSTGVFDKFSYLPGVVEKKGGAQQRYMYIPGKRKDRILLAAHADTVWDKNNLNEVCAQEVKFSQGSYSGKNPKYGIGADDRAGCAMLYLLRESGHSLLLLDGEEGGMIGSRFLRDSDSDLFDEINRHCYIVQLDRRNSTDYKCYSIPVSEEFIKFVEDNTGYTDAGKNAATDIVVLCRDICGVNFSVGYYNEHTSGETLCFDDWFNTLKIVEKLISAPQKKYPIVMH